MSPANGYGAAESSPRHGNLDGADEERPLLSNTLSSKPTWREKLTVNVRRERADIILLLCYIITGLLDSASISTWGSFVSMQTGNTVYIGLGITSPSTSNRWIKSLTSLASFCVGSFFFSRFHRFFTPSKRWVLCLSFLLQTTFIVAAAVILTLTSPAASAPAPAKPTESIDWTVLVPIALVAFQSCGQAVVSRALKFNALTSVVLTSIYCDLFSDAELFAVSNVERNRRVGAPLLLLLGAVFGGLLARLDGCGVVGVLWIAATLKLAVVLTWLWWPGEEQS